MFIITIVITFTLMRFYTSLTKEQENINNLLEQITVINSNQIEDMFNEMDRLTYNIAVADITQEALKRAIAYEKRLNYFDENLNDKRALIQMMQLLAGENLRGTSVDVVSIRGDYVLLDTYDSFIFNREQVRKIYEMALFDELDRNKYIKNIEEDSFGRTKEQMFSYMRKVSDEFGDYGYIEIQKTESSLNDIFKMPADTFGILSLVTYEEDLFYAMDGNTAKWKKYISALSGYLPNKNESNQYIRAEINQKAYLFYASAVNKYGIRVYTLLPESYFTERIIGEILMLIAQGVIMVISMIVLITLVSKRLYQPVIALRQRIKHYELNSLSAEIGAAERSEDTDEIETFHQAFLKMIERIQKQNDEIIQRKTRELQVSYQALRAQVSPHFLYNTLYLIGLKGEEYDAPEVLDMCSNLSRMMSYCIDNQTDMVPFHQEILYMNHYLELMKCRYLDKLMYEVKMDDEINQILVPKFILQPLVENCFTHGFKNSNAEHFMIQIYLKKQNQNWSLIIEDNGSGFAKEDQARITKDIAFIKQSILNANGTFLNETLGIGLINTYARLFISFSESVSLFIGSGEMGGGLIRITCPAGKETQTNETSKDDYSGR
jgi:sensor histidine kinase YesM